MGKRSPILGYNHNVRYRGLVFHVQTEDSGVSSPHLFTHLFHHGVIVSTRKLDYDAGSAEESIKSLMQAQHKAVLKDLRRGQFDDKIDSYLGGTPGLLPRGVDEAVERPSEIELAPSAGTVEDLALGAPTEQVLPMLDELSAPVIVVEKAPAPARNAKSMIPPVPPRGAAPTPPATPLAARGSAAVVDTTLKTAAPEFEIASESELSAPEIEIVEDSSDDEPAPPPRRPHRDTQTQLRAGDRTRRTGAEPDDQARPQAASAEDARRAAMISDGIPVLRPSSPAIPLLPPPDSRRPGDRPSTINAATLPPARPISRPPSRPALGPQVVSRPLPPDDRNRRESEGIEVYSPALPSAELPPGERPGQYAQHKKVNQVGQQVSQQVSQRIPTEGIKQERSGGVPVPVPAGLGRPQRVASAPVVKQGTPVPVSASIPAARDPSSRSPNTEPLRGRVPTPARLPVTSRTSTGGGGGVVMTRPAVIVGAPSKTTGTVPRIRKAREDEGRGFGQGLISEKSLDEVILAYLSEDADEK